MPQSQKVVFKKEMERLVKVGVFERQPESEWGSPVFVIPKADQTVRFLTDFRVVDKRIVLPMTISGAPAIFQEKMSELILYAPWSTYVHTLMIFS